MPFSRKSGGDQGFQRVDISSITCAIGDVLAYDRSNHVCIKALSTTSVEDIAGVCVEAATTADTSVLVQKIVTEDDEFIADCTNNSSPNHNYQRMILTDAATVNNTGTDSTNDAAMIMQLYPVGVAGDKKIRCKFVRVQDRA